MKKPWLVFLNTLVFVVTPFLFPPLQTFFVDTFEVGLSYQGLALVYMGLYIIVLVVDIIRAVRASIDLSIRGIIYLWVGGAVWFFGMGIWSCLQFIELPDGLGGFGQIPLLIIVAGTAANVANLVAIAIAGVQARTREIDNNPG